MGSGAVTAAGSHGGMWLRLRLFFLWKGADTQPPPPYVASSPGVLVAPRHSTPLIALTSPCRPPAPSRHPGWQVWYHSPPLRSFEWRCCWCGVARPGLKGRRGGSLEVGAERALRGAAWSTRTDLTRRSTVLLSTIVCFLRLARIRLWTWFLSDRAFPPIFRFRSPGGSRDGDLRHRLP